jgi:hypothetical protein
MTEKLGEVVTKWWPVLLATLLAVCGIASMWGVSTAQISSLGAGQARIETKLEAITQDLGAVKTGAAVAAIEISEFRERLRTVEQRRGQER